MNLNQQQLDEVLRKARNGTLAANDQHWQTIQRGYEVGNRQYVSTYQEVMRHGGPNAGQSGNKII